MPYLNYNLLGFNISATDIEVKANATQINDESDQNIKTRLDQYLIRQVQSEL